MAIAFFEISRCQSVKIARNTLLVELFGDELIAITVGMTSLLLHDINILAILVAIFTEISDILIDAGRFIFAGNSNHRWIEWIFVPTNAIDSPLTCFKLTF